MCKETDEAAEIARQLTGKGLQLTGAAWEVEQVLHRLRHARVGASGIQHRVIEEEQVLLKKLRQVAQRAKDLL